IVLRSGGRGVAIDTRLGKRSTGAVIHAEDKLAGKVHYFCGKTSLTGIPTYGRVRYEGGYPGIDLVYFGNQTSLEYDFEVRPGADPRGISLHFDGVDALAIDPEGNLVLHADESEFVQHRPVIYQKVRNSRREIDGRYRLLAGNTVGFEVGPY